MKIGWVLEAILDIWKMLLEMLGIEPGSSDSRADVLTTTPRPPIFQMSKVAPLYTTDCPTVWEEWACISFLNAKLRRGNAYNTFFPVSTWGLLYLPQWEKSLKTCYTLATPMMGGKANKPRARGENLHLFRSPSMSQGLFERFSHRVTSPSPLNRGYFWLWTRSRG